jgi:hypothetical protein
MSTLEERVERLERRVQRIDGMLLEEVTGTNPASLLPSEPGGFEVHTVEWPPEPGPEAMERARKALSGELIPFKGDPGMAQQQENRIVYLIARAIEEAVAEEGDKGRRVRKNQTQAHGEIVADLRARLAEAEKALEAEREQLGNWIVKHGDERERRILVREDGDAARAKLAEAEKALSDCRAGRDELSKGWDLCMKERDETRAALHDAHEALVEPIDLDEARKCLRSAMGEEGKW